MPYRSNDDLPPSVKRHLPPHAQDIYRAAFNHAFGDHAGDPRQEEAAHRIARGQAILCENGRKLDRAGAPAMILTRFGCIHLVCHGDQLNQVVGSE